MTITDPARADPVSAVQHRLEVRGKFLYVGDDKFYLRGVTYGTFRPDEDGAEFHNPEQVKRDFAMMAAHGINTLRVYTVPPRWMLDLAAQAGLRLMVGLPWEQHITFLDDRARVDSIEARVREGVRSCAGHPAVLCYTIGNEIPAPIVRWHGKRPIEGFLQRLYRAVKDEDPDSLVTYVNYPSTEYLTLPFVDFVCFNVYLESRETLQAYIARLQNLAGDKPLVMAEIGLDSRRHGEMTQATTLDWQIRTVFAAGCAGAFVFAWTDEWYRGGFDIEDWDFGLTDRERRPKPALEAVQAAFREVPFPPDTAWPRVSVVVCSYNGSRTLRDTCEGLIELDYPDFEVIVVDDGSKDRTPDIAREYGFRVISTENRGLSAARNTGMEAATGEIVAYCDDDARPDPHWLQYLAWTFLTTDVVGVGGPNIAPPGDGWIADCVANSPGGPVHVLLSDTVAEHIPGCNMAYRNWALQAVGGFDPRYRVAGDDVDLCWRLQDRGWTIGFSPAAMVWHHRRNSLRTYWKQQKGYGRAEALLEAKWPDRYNTAGHYAWGGRLYGKGLTLPLPGKSLIYHGSWGSAPFQSMYEPLPGLIRSLPLMPEWYLGILLLAAVSALGTLWRPFLAALPFLVTALALPAAQAFISAYNAHFTTRPLTPARHAQLRAVTALLHFLQPNARLIGRIRAGLTLWRRRGPSGWVPPVPRQAEIWSQTWRDPIEWLTAIERELQSSRSVVLRGNDFDQWDLTVRGGLFATARLLLANEEHGGGKQLLRIRIWPSWRPAAPVLSLTLILLLVAAASAGAWVVTGVLLLVLVGLLVRLAWEGGNAVAAANSAAHAKSLMDSVTPS
jgi:GT2 family glycosyltransferase